MCISYAISGSCYLLNGEGSYLVEVYTTRIFDFLAGWVWGGETECVEVGGIVDSQIQEFLSGHRQS